MSLTIAPTRAAAGDVLDMLTLNNSNAVTASALTPEMAAWMRQCPDVASLRELVETAIWFNKTVRCYECGEKYQRRELRYDEATPGCDGTTLICRGCWDSFEGGLLGDPDYRPPQWPESLQRNFVPEQRIDGIIYLMPSHVRVGVVQGYLRKWHTAERVTLDSMPECAEGGTLDPDCVVEPYETAVATATDESDGTTSIDESDSDSLSSGEETSSE